MSNNTSIEWTDATWNPTTGCTKVSGGCDHCYAEGIAHRFAGTPAYPNGFQVTLRPERLSWPLRRRKPSRIFVNSMSDLFHADVPDDYIAHVWAVMARAQHHTFQVLTKRHSRMRSLLNSDLFRRNMYDHLVSIDYAWIRDTPLAWPLPNVWLGVSTEDQRWADTRIPALLDTPAAVRFISAEPLLGPIELLEHFGSGPAVGGPAALDWVIVGGESGPGARPMHPDWPRGLRDQCALADVPFLFKQWGAFRPIDHGCIECASLYIERETGRVATDDDMWNVTGGHWWGVERMGKKAAGRELDGRTWDEFPTAGGVPA